MFVVIEYQVRLLGPHVEGRHPGSFVEDALLRVREPGHEVAELLMAVQAQSQNFPGNCLVEVADVFVELLHFFVLQGAVVAIDDLSALLELPVFSLQNFEFLHLFLLLLLLLLDELLRVESF